MILRKIMLTVLSLVALASIAGRQALAVVAYDEESAGDLSGDYTTPTTINLLPGSNLLSAATGSRDDGLDLEYVRVNVPGGHQLSELTLLAYSGDDSTAFVGLQSGPAFTFHADDVFSHIGDLLGWSHIGPGGGKPVGSNLLPALGANGQTFVPPLGGPTYTFWIQQMGSVIDYQLDFVVTPVPEPASCLLMASVLPIALARSRSRRAR